MKNIIYTIFSMTLCLVLVMSCEKDEIDNFSAAPAINFVNDSIQYSFIQEVSNEYILEVPVAIIGNTADYDRYFNVEVLDDELTTATTDLYEIIEGKVPAGEFTGNLLVKLKKSPILDDTSVSIHIASMTSDDFVIGNTESNTTKLIWTNKIVIPAWRYFGFFFTRYSSSAAYRVFLATTGLTDFSITDYRAVGPTGAQALGKAFGDYIRQYEIDNGTPLLHDDGDHAGEVIVPIY
ncbi:DUF4843 domain-containing protein [Algibacter miyuki]|uniref:DUF4843 domain-containing protein n=1 Tax=Algibacter miyuki TaxID=1306933 RepID=A0ABV5H1E8_9FLAO|nr:DUF4843 domain-containing protein [Algibacter miyuki]MDN3667574.1 DUF4843 domain-containing protein [Algibacter miyuki]